ncbi:hypothetical protein SEA_NENAE_30 [Mycobacterium phage Nenae]|uniref:Uncharacterized protein n=1 Tax=Mycobacterium phage Nenae TaxID=2530136 RepID=A0A481VZY3_9CAUD|nr:hypothetical protein SEA_NENAE_30 [Mycobacterium phage Nenae]
MRATVMFTAVSLPAKAFATGVIAKKVHGTAPLMINVRAIDVIARHFATVASTAASRFAAARRAFLFLGRFVVNCEALRFHCSRPWKCQKSVLPRLTTRSHVGKDRQLTVMESARRSPQRQPVFSLGRPQSRGGNR